jgi:hypothetical protein
MLVAIPRVFISSTFEDLRYVRENLEHFVDGYGFAPALSEAGDIFYDPAQHRLDSCLTDIESCQLMILVIGQRRGSDYKDECKSIVRAEYEKAVNCGIPIFVLVEARVLAEYRLWLRGALAAPSAESIEVFELLREIETRPTNNTLQGFSRFSEIEGYLRLQWASMWFKVWAGAAGAEREGAVLGLIQAATGTLDRVGASPDVEEEQQGVDTATLPQALILSKSRFQLGLQCQRQLWLRCHRPDLADHTTELQQHVFDIGTRVGELARDRFPNGVLVDEDYLHAPEAIEHTNRLLADAPSTVFEGAFAYGGVLVRPDVLVRLADGSWDLYEVKSSTKVKPENISDVAVQVWVLEGAGLKIRRANLMHLDNTYVYQGGDYDLTRLFAAEDSTAEVCNWLADLPVLVEEMLSILAAPEPQRRIGKQCDNPYTCGFHGYCHDSLPERSITKLPRVTDDLIAALLAAGITCIDDVPPMFPGLTTAQRTVCETVRRGTPRYGAGLARSLGGLAFPVHFLDFETFMSALPLYEGTRPWQQVPFEWSDDVLAADGTLEHREFLFEGEGDPRPSFAETLLEALGDAGSVVAYHAAFEDMILRQVADALPEHAVAIERVRGRLFDLEKPVRDFVQHPEMLGSSSLKVVLPALVDTLGYDGLAIHEGGTASLRYLRCAQGELTPAERAELFADLREYCGTDTMAMVELYRAMLEAGPVE